ncbi:MAG: SMP-30/gluconolactonase/LRE family protein [Planctomycetaceae bacterium]|nr:SMP-30/gluconolactonase/LRE family protein [Planctomycetales bacterium]MCB9873867.1 SMP-30/gluconolactonase/LRE family protein [Planctomycetaceae bacterium]
MSQESTRESNSILPTLGRRSFLAVAATATASTVLGRDYGSDAAPVRYPEPDVVVLDERFAKYKLGNSPIQRLYHSKEMLWAEGTAWNGVGRYLVWSDIPNNVQMRWLEEDGHVSVFRNPSGNSNGNTFDYQGRQISCQHGPRRVVRYEYDGSVSILAETYGGKSLNAPNDAVVHPNGDIWFTDPGYGGLMDYEGTRANTGSVQPFQKEAIYRIDSKSGKLHQVADQIFKPNGLCFSPDYKKLYVADTGASHYGDKAPKVIKVWDVIEESTLANDRVFASMELELNGEKVAGFADGIRCDVDGNIWASAGWVGDGYDGAHIFAPDGTRIGQIYLPEICGNLCFGGTKRNRLFMAGSQSLYAVYVETTGAHIA